MNYGWIAQRAEDAIAKMRKLDGSDPAPIDWTDDRPEWLGGMEEASNKLEALDSYLAGNPEKMTPDELVKAAREDVQAAREKVNEAHRDAEVWLEDYQPTQEVVDANDAHVLEEQGSVMLSDVATMAAWAHNQGADLMDLRPLLEDPTFIEVVRTVQLEAPVGKRDVVGRRVVFPVGVWQAIEHEARGRGIDTSALVVEMVTAAQCEWPYQAPEPPVQTPAPVTGPDPALEGFL